jgi:hypothetical protein
MLTAIPLTIIPLIVYNLIALIFPGAEPDASWTRDLFGLTMVSGARWALTMGDLMAALAIACLFFEIMKSGRTGNATIANHMLSTVVLIVYIIEFILVYAAATSLFFILTLIALFDVIAGFTITIRTASRDVSYTPVTSYPPALSAGARSVIRGMAR